jgi:hypothetical protein
MHLRFTSAEPKADLWLMNIPFRINNLKNWLASEDCKSLILQLRIGAIIPLENGSLHQSLFTAGSLTAKPSEALTSDDANALPSMRRRAPLRIAVLLSKKVLQGVSLG